jgi:regulator of sirC expression with transglutaminase-like and TPR domain
VDSFGEALREPIDLGRAALRLGLVEDAELDLPAWEAQLDRLGAAAAERIPQDGDLEGKLRALTGYLFAELGLLGNEQDYYDPRNSYIHKVLERGLGIPISLSVVTIEIGRRAGLGLHGIGFPAHFLVGAGHNGGSQLEVFLDPFHQGRLLDREACAELLRRFTGGAIPFNPQLLAPISARAILTRMLRNLKGTHLRRGELDLALLDVDRLILLDAGTDERRDRGLIQLARRVYADAVADLEAYLATEPSDAELIEGRLEEARRGLERS